MIKFPLVTICDLEMPEASATETKAPLEQGNPRPEDDVVMEDREGHNRQGRHLEVVAEEGEEEDDDDGPPPGWETLRPLNPPKERETTEEGDPEDEDDGPPPGWPSIAPPPITSTADGPQVPAQAPQSISKPPPPPGQSSVLAQMVCGSCRKLLAYAHGARYVKCPCCKTVNFVLEEHQVGQVKCGTCAVLLMYPFGAPAVKCSSCRSVTEIGEHNKRPPWSVQQGHCPPPGTVP